MTDLSLLKPDEEGIVTDILKNGGLGRRLSDIGLTAGMVVRCLFESPSGDPKAYLIRGAVIALRRADAAEIKVRRL